MTKHDDDEERERELDEWIKRTFGPKGSFPAGSGTKIIVWVLYGLAVWEGWLIAFDAAHRPRHATIALLTLCAIYVVTLKDEKEERR